ncbi:MAG TPA: hypothetical protein VFU31_13225, partial [Candidatus Binatia bacterium]|nr:hypothetical protein [Candidatus Binatia bacterium]
MRKSFVALRPLDDFLKKEVAISFLCHFSPVNVSNLKQLTPGAFADGISEKCWLAFRHRKQRVKSKTVFADGQKPTLAKCKFLVSNLRPDRTLWADPGGLPIIAYPKGGKWMYIKGLVFGIVMLGFLLPAG